MSLLNAPTALDNVTVIHRETFLARDRPDGTRSEERRYFWLWREGSAPLRAKLSPEILPSYNDYAVGDVVNVEVVHGRLSDGGTWARIESIRGTGE